MFLQSEEKVSAYNEPFSNGYCALTSRIVDQQYMSATIPDRDAFISVLAYGIADNSFCKAFNHHTVVVLDFVVPKAVEKKIVVVKAEEMTKKLYNGGKIALYGIYFDTDRAAVKVKSNPTLVEIAKMLRKNPEMKILVVGHTDNKGDFDYNLDLSQRRARAVVTILTTKYAIAADRLKPFGVSYGCPTATNSTEQGRAKNRRVELVVR